MARLIGIVATTIVLGIALTCVHAEDCYSTKYDNIDINGILNNDRLRNQHRMCYMSRGPCPTADMKFFKEFIGEAVITKCKKCSEKQKQHLNTLTEWYVENRPEEWREFIEKIISDLRAKNA